MTQEECYGMNKRPNIPVYSSHVFPIPYKTFPNSNIDTLFAIPVFHSCRLVGLLLLRFLLLLGGILGGLVGLLLLLLVLLLGLPRRRWRRNWRRRAAGAVDLGTLYK